MTERTLGNVAAPDTQSTPQEATVEHLRTTTFDSPRTAAEHCGLILRDIQSVGERSRMAMQTGYAEAQAAKIDLGTYTTRMQELYDKAKADIDNIIAQLAAIQANIEDPLNTLPADQKTLIVNVIRTGVEQANRSKQDIVDQLEQQRVRRPHQEEIKKNLGKTREAYAIAAAAGTLAVGETDPEHIAPSADNATRLVRENKRPESLAEGVDNRAVQYEDAELRARAVGLSKLLDERLANVDATLAAQAGMHGLGFETMAQMRKAYESLQAYKLISNNDWRDPAKSGIAARFLGNLNGHTAVNVLLAAGSLAAFASGFMALGTGVALARTVKGGMMGYFMGEKIGRARAERQAIEKGNADVPVPENLDPSIVSDDQLTDLIARMEYKSLISGKSLRATTVDGEAQTTATETTPTTNEAIIDPEYKRLIEELQRRSEMDKDSARSYSTSLETKIRQTNARLRELLQDREGVERAAKIGGVVGGLLAAFGPSLIRGGWEGMWQGLGYDGYSALHGAAAPIVGNANAEYISGTGAYSPDALAATHLAAIQTPAPGVGPIQGPELPPTQTPAPSVSSVPYGPEAPQMINGQPVYGPELPPTAPGVPTVPGVPTPDAGSFVPDKTEFAHYMVGKGEGVSWPLKAQLIEHADKYGWDGTSDKTKWATKKMFELMKSEEFTIDGKSMAIYNADIDKQLWVDQPDRYSFILKYDGHGGYSMDVYDMKAPGGPALLSGNYDQALSEHTISDPQGAGSGAAQHAAGGPNHSGSSLNQAPTGPNAAPAPQFDQNGNSLTGGPSASGPMPGNLAPNAHNKVQWYDQSGYQSEGKYKDALFAQIQKSASAQETWSFGAVDPSSDISSQLRVNHLLPLDKMNSTGVQFSDSFRTIKDFTGSVPNSVKEQLFNQGHPAFGGKFGRLADEYAQLKQAEYVLEHSTSLNKSIVSPADIAAMKKAIAKELAERVKKLAEFEGALKEDIRPARIFGNN